MEREADVPPLTEAEGAAFLEALLEAGVRCTPVEVPAGFAERCTPAQAQALHRLHVQRLLQRLGGTVTGVKLGGTSAAAFRLLGIDTPFIGPIFSARTHASPARLARADFIVAILEPEIGVRLGRDLDTGGALPARATVLDAIDELFPTLEIADARIAGWSAPSLKAVLADASYAGAWVRGAPVAGWRALDLPALQALLTHDGATVREGRGASVLGDPLHALALAAAGLSRQGRPLRAGDVVSTGTFTPPYPAGRGGRFVADFGALGAVSLELA